MSELQLADLTKEESYALDVMNRVAEALLARAKFLNGLPSLQHLVMTPEQALCAISDFNAGASRTIDHECPALLGVAISVHGNDPVTQMTLEKLYTQKRLVLGAIAVVLHHDRQANTWKLTTEYDQNFPPLTIIENPYTRQFELSQGFEGAILSSKNIPFGTPNIVNNIMRTIQAWISSHGTGPRLVYERPAPNDLAPCNN